MICTYLYDFVVKFLNKFPADEIEKILITNHDEIEFIEILQTKTMIKREDLIEFKNKMKK